MSQRLVLDGKPVAREIIDHAREELDRFVKETGQPPRLAAVIAGSRPDSVAYLNAIKRSCRRAGIELASVSLPDDITAVDLTAAIEALNHDVSVNGIIVLQPLPRHVPPDLASRLIAPEKDVDGITIENVGRLALGQPALLPSTPAGGMAILSHYDMPLSGRRAVVVGRSPVVGKPLALLLLQADATVTICHSRSREIDTITRQADILLAAAGKAGLIVPEMVQPGAVVIDFGVNVVDGKLIGDVDSSVAGIASAMTPVPGGTGVVTNAILIRQTVQAAWQQFEARG